MKGYSGRIGIYELLMVTDAMRAAVTRRLDAVQLKKLAVSEGMKTLREDGIAKALAGVTTIDEVLRVTQDDVVSFD
jgi:type II secretory ATPase GspE/PulE/Tfp pilus assembly ATPase PilB-like protein